MRVVPAIGVGISIRPSANKHCQFPNQTYETGAIFVLKSYLVVYHINGLAYDGELAK